MCIFGDSNFAFVILYCDCHDVSNDRGVHLIRLEKIAIIMLVIVISVVPRIMPMVNTLNLN